MTFLPITPHDSLKPEARAAGDIFAASHNDQLTNLQAALLENVPSFGAYAQWYSLWDEIAPWIGERALSHFAYAISDENGCPGSALHFRKTLVEAGDDPDQPQVTETEQLLIDWGRLIVRSPHDIPQDFYDRLEAAFSAERRLILLAFAGLTVAMNLLNTVGRVPLDDGLSDYRRDSGDDA
ncbi:hypothetical protein [Glaciihabitans sp. UYNi722]|uniref:hypothetical protein n=1 Tax=Glaciihabitans sp. UYNi722 TaxID=3156344 RepID=UPI0033980E49